MLLAENNLSIAISTLPPPSYTRTLGFPSAYARSRDLSVADGRATASTTVVSLSAEAEQAAKTMSVYSRLKLPDTSYWMRRDFPDDIMAEAKSRLAERQAAPGIGDGYLPSSISNLPLLQPETRHCSISSVRR